jgi:hypothetical protein
MENPEKPNISGQDDIGKIEVSRDRFLEKEYKKLDEIIASTFELKARIDSWANPVPGDIQTMVDSWNKEHSTPLEGRYVEREFKRPDGRTLRVMMDKRGNIRLGGNFETSQ